MKAHPKNIILGIDPGTRITGYGVLEMQAKKMRLVQFGVLHLHKYDDHYQRLGKIFERLTHIIGEFGITQMALEAPFYGKNIQSTLKLGRAQGVAMAAALSQGIPVYEYAPKRIKQAVTGQGSASKEQVARMLQQILDFEQIPDLLDATDAVSVAVCHGFQGGIPGGMASASGSSWQAFVSQNPNRIK
ncbi:MAG: crossover junction endodeoxyribonuclease RuvC [Bernardetiaceae bacterium]